MGNENKTAEKTAETKKEVKAYESKYARALYPVIVDGKEQNIEFVNYQFITDNIKVQRGIETSSYFENTVWENAELLAPPKHSKRQSSIVSGARFA